MILLVFLRRPESTAVVALAMPISVLGAFICMYGAGLSMNLFSLTGLTLALGMDVFPNGQLGLPIMPRTHIGVTVEL